MASRIVIEEPCEHGHMYGYGPHGMCRGGTRRVLTKGEYVLIEKVEGEWPDAAIGVMARAWLASEHQHLGGQLEDGLDALAGGES